MADRNAWHAVLEVEARRWSSMSSDELLAELDSAQSYEVERDSKKYQVEVEVLEETDAYLKIMVAVLQDRACRRDLMMVRYRPPFCQRPLRSSGQSDVAYGSAVFTPERMVLAVRHGTSKLPRRIAGALGHRTRSHHAT